MKPIILTSVYTVFFVFMLLIYTGGAEAAMFTIDDAADSFVVGDFLVHGNNEASGTGQNYEVLKFKPSGSATSATASDGSALDQAPHGDIKIGELWTHLTNNGISKTNSLVFGFDENETDDVITIDALTISFDGHVFTLGANSVDVTEHTGEGSNTAEALFQIDLGYDFISTYSAASMIDFFIEATHSGASAGFDEYFLSALHTAQTPNAVVIPEPATFLLLGLGGLAGLLNRKKFFF